MSDDRLPGQGRWKHEMINAMPDANADPREIELLQAGMREAMKPLVLFMHGQRIKSITLDKTGGHVKTLVAFEDEA